MTNQQPTITEANKRKKTVWYKSKLTIGIISLVFIGLIALNLNRVVITYYYLFKFDHFSTGDKVYLKKNNPFGAGPLQSVVLSRLIKPLTAKEIDTMLVDDHQKAVLKLKVDDNTLKPYMINVRDYIDSYDKSRLVGTYINDVVVYTKTPDEKYVWQHYYAITPDTKALNKLFNKQLPQGYTWADNNYYIYPMFLSTDPQQ